VKLKKNYFVRKKETIRLEVSSWC